MKAMEVTLKEFCTRYGISTRKLAAICGGEAGGMSKSSMHRLINGQATEIYVTKILPHILLSLTAFLVAQGKSPSTIKAELEPILPTGFSVPRTFYQAHAPVKASVILRDAENRIVQAFEVDLTAATSPGH